MISVIVIGACATSALIVWAVCGIYWSGHYAAGLIDGRAEALESRIEHNRAPAPGSWASFEAARAIARHDSHDNVIDLVAWRQWASRPGDPLPDAETVTMGQVIPVPAIGTSEVDQWIDKVLSQITERIYGP